MKTFVRIPVYRVYPNGANAGEQMTFPREQFNHLAKLNGIEPTEKQSGFGVEGLEDDPRVRAMVEQLRLLTGLDPAHFVGVGMDREKEFFVFRHREFTKQEIDAARYLVMMPQPELAYLDHFAPDETPVIKVNAWLTNKRQFGVFFPSWAFGIASPLAEAVAKAGLKGFLLKPVTYAGDPSKYGKQLWHLTSSVVLPRTKSPIANNRSEPFDGDIEKGCHFVSRYSPSELIYDRRQIEAFGGFDIAVTTERIGAGSRIATRLVIVSQRFRAAFAEQGVKGCKFEPVTLE